jgi:Tfp pilus assembly protein PilN
MKKLFIVLLLANIALFGYAYFDRMNSAAQASADRFKPLNAEQVKVLTAQQVAKLGPAKVAQLTLACAEWGPISESDRARANKLLEPLALGKTLLSRRVEVTAEHWIYIPPKSSRSAADKALADLKKLGVSDSAVVLEPGQWNFAISLGVFRNKDGADARLAEVKSKGVKTATYRQREQTLAMTALVLREPTQATVSKLEELRAQVPGSTVTTGACPESRS